MDGLVGTVEAGEATVELECSAADQRTCASDNEEHVPAQ